MSSGTRSRVAFNTLSGTAAQVIVMAIGLVTTPLILHSLGATEFGGYAVLASLSTYFGVLDLGIGGSLTRFMVFYNERGDRTRVGVFATFGMLFYLAMGAVLLPALYAIAPAIGHFLAFPAGLQTQSSALIPLVGALFIGWALIGIISARLAAAHRLDVTALANVCGALGMAVLIYTLVPLYPRVETVFACMAGQLVLVWLVLLVANRRLNGRLLVSPRLVRWRETREIFSFGLWSQLSSITAVVNLEADKVIISRGMGVANVTPYHVANRMALLSRALPLQLLGSLLPAVTARVSGGMTKDELADLYRSSSRALMLPTLLISGFVAGIADPLLRLWLGARLPGAAALCTALVLSYSVNNLTGAGSTILRAQGRPQLETFYGILSAVLNIVLTVLLIGPFGLSGVVMGTIAGNVIGSAVFIAVFHRRERFAWWRTMGAWLVPLCVITLVSALSARAVLDGMAGATADRMTLLTSVIVAGLGYCAVFVLLGRVFRLWTTQDHALLDRLLVALRIRRARAT